MNMDTKKDVVRASRRVECLGLEQDAVKEIGPETVPSNIESPAIDHSSGFNPYDTGILYKK